MKLAVIILNYNSGADCRKCIADLKRQTFSEAEIVVVDNCSREDDADAVRQFCRENGCTFISSASNRGYNAGNNVGLRYAAGNGCEFVLVCNPDVEFPQPGYVQKLIDIMEGDEKIAVCGSDIVTPEGIHQNPKYCPECSWQQSFRWIGEVFRSRSTGPVPEWVEDPGHSRFCKAVNGCCLMLRMSFLKQIGFFDERTFLYGEEPILGRQVEMSGWKMYYAADVAAVHNHRKSREGSHSFCARHWRHSQLVYLRFYSGYPFYGKCFAALSVFIYFTMLELYHLVRKNG